MNDELFFQSIMNISIVFLIMNFIVFITIFVISNRLKKANQINSDIRVILLEQVKKDKSEIDYKYFQRSLSEDYKSYRFKVRDELAILQKQKEAKQRLDDLNKKT